MAFVLLAPALAEATGLEERDFGLALTFIFIGTALSSPMTSIYMRWCGSVGVQILALIWMSLAMLVILQGSWWATIFAAFLFGLGYGPLGPIGMAVVTERTPNYNRGLFLSIRQSSQPLAGVVLGRVLPPFVAVAGWQLGVTSTAAAIFMGVLVIMLWPHLYRLRDDAAARRAPVITGDGSGLLSTLVQRFTIPAGMRVLWLSGMVFAISQIGMVFFSYIYMLEAVKLTPIAAGIFASNLQLAGLFGRPVFGWVCDRIGRTEYVLIAIALMSTATAFALLSADATWSATALFMLALACGFSGQAWNAVFTAALSEIVPRERLAEMNGRAFAFLSVGWMSAAPFCWFLIETFASYRPMYLTLMVLNIAVAVILTVWSFNRHSPAGRS